jgi:hypothetical protein
MRAASLSLAMALCGGTAQAAIMQATYSGTIESGSDLMGIWGAAGADLAGLNAAAVFIYDTGLGYHKHTASFDWLNGGADFGALSPQSPIVDAWFEIGGQKLHYTGDFLGEAFLGDAAGYMSHAASTTTPSSVAFFNAAGRFDTAGLDLTKGFSAALDKGSEVDADYFDKASNAYTVVMRPTLLSVSSLNAAVPETETWAMMVFGFAAIGGLLRRSRAAALA